MKTFLVTFQKEEYIDMRRDDKVCYGFPFSVVDGALVGTPREKPATECHRALISIENNRLPAWGFRLAGQDELNHDLMKILFQYGMDHVREVIEKESLPPPEQRSLPQFYINTFNAPNKCPFDPGAIPEPNGHTIEVEIKNRMGFHP